MTNEDLRDEVQAINAIYGEGSLSTASESSVFILRLPHQSMALRLSFPDNYPVAPPSVLGTETSGEQTRKGEGASVVRLFRDVLGNVFQSGEVCLFNVIEDVKSILNFAGDDLDDHADNEQTDMETCNSGHGRDSNISKGADQRWAEDEPMWAISDVITELKSVFVARCTLVSSPEQPKIYLDRLLRDDKKLRSATHNITAWRIVGKNGVAFQDCDDDSETAAGSRLLHLMRLMGVWNCMIVVTRWYGGHQLGPKRFSIINTVARDAFVKGNFVPAERSIKRKSGLP